MKKVNKLLLVLCGFYLTGNAMESGIVYPEKSLIAYSNNQAQKADGKILPTTTLKVLGTEGNKLKVSIEGWRQTNQPNILYYATEGRIISVVLDTNVVESKVLENKDSLWQRVSLILWIDKVDMNASLDAVYIKAKNVLQEQCGLCHAPHPAEEFSANQWPSVIEAMLDRTSMTNEDKELVVQYVQKNAKK